MKLLKYILLLGLFSTTWSCQDYLERFPLDSPSDETFLRSEAELDMAVTACYNRLWYKPPGTDQPFMLSLECASDLGWDRNSSGLQTLGRGSATPDNDYTGSFWEHFYRGVGRCNYILAKAGPLAETVPEEKYNRLLAEVRFLRAYFYSYLNELFGGVPLLTEPVELAESEIPRSSREEVTDFILAELDAALPYLLPVTDKSTAGRATQGAALALKSRIALYNERWETAAQAASQLMEEGNYQLHDHYGELFQYAGEDSPEIIFAVQYLKGTAVHSLARLYYSRIALGHSNKIPVQPLVDAYECTDGLTIDKSPGFDPDEPFANRDPRLGYTVVLPQSRFINYIFETHPDSTETWSYNTNPPTRVNNVESSHAYATFSGYLWRKYADVADKDDRDNSELNVTLMRYAEVLLNYAEAKIELNQIDQSVYDAINAVRGRPSVEMPLITPGKNQAEMRSIVRKERKYELAGEGLRLFDIRRWKIAGEVMPGKLLGRIPDDFLAEAPVIDENGTPHYENVSNAGQMRVIENRLFDEGRDYLWPIRRLELETNPALEQNPGYGN
ncbi:putative outer membrane starch-binding protein [Anseongella ginsenosidimutans]|uniref:Putative outer membrane starch-binding protein n=1 Tax=Anseongella ginsenosidimutans TaxID=496056 RepID=A0A4V2UTC6_9SPHI|nr:RagB/SusD family nutrient uptake outer membrane protein [Anseongella ginsenosidimutans]QEC52500.1 RagB/SusD family nutrient uptake outer membrane protein [Anseongella ginsenosidimutans]TCS85319.1 putative outer membrane starch-binding protein [Anseongella ginsenosidimutans]